MCLEEKNSEYKTQFLNVQEPLYNADGLNEKAAIMSRWLYDPTGQVRDRQATIPGTVVEGNDYFDVDQPKMCGFYPDPKAIHYPVNKQAVKVLGSTTKVLMTPENTAFFVPELARGTGSGTQGPPYSYAITGKTSAGAFTRGKQTVEFNMKIPAPKYFHWSRLHQKTLLAQGETWDPDTTQGPDNFTPFLVPHYWTDNPAYYNASNAEFASALGDYEKLVTCQYDIYVTVEPNITRAA